MLACHHACYYQRCGYSPFVIALAMKIDADCSLSLCALKTLFINFFVAALSVSIYSICSPARISNVRYSSG